ncbi:MAG: cobyric acid synthase [Eubacteriales bacterium]|nr:cobyric acid synthase [Eubacteriales bacterium]
MARVIMIQGTMSNVGKSLLTAGLCRIFKQDGYRVAPFKSQNMALNSYITEDGLEMGRAQAMQAEACGICPSVLMNPILLKPTTDMGSQVIIRGEVIGTMHAVDYFRHKKDYLPIVKQSFEKLNEAYDIIVIEGAGSPAEINLKQDDIVNMGLAELVDAPVVLVGDINPGGVFAQLIGTTMLLTEKEQQRIKGFIINKFRGDRTILEPGIHMLEERANKKVLGVVPYMDVMLEDEDSLAGQFESKQKADGQNMLDVAVIRLPRISNFTDLQPLMMEPQVNVRYVERVSELSRPDLIIIPGTKNTISDLLWMRKNGIEAEILRAVKEDVPVIGICGGYQMLGDTLKDTKHVECEWDEIRGIGLLPITTWFKEQKTRTRVHGVCEHMDGMWKGLNNVWVSGYEIHMGMTEFSGAYDGQWAIRIQNQADGCSVGNVFGTYLHGLFDETEFRRGLLNILCEKKGMLFGETENVSYVSFKEAQFDKLALCLRESLDMKAIYQILGLETQVVERHNRK